MQRAMHAACGGGGGRARHDAGQQHRSSMPVQLYSTTVQYDSTRATVAAAPGRRVLLLLLRCASRRPAARLGIRSYSRTALLKSHRRAFTTTH
jgi:hypothetical protein